MAVILQVVGDYDGKQLAAAQKDLDRLKKSVGDTSPMKAAAGGWDGFTSAAASAGKRAESVGRKMTVGLTVPLVAAGGAAVKMASDQEQAFGAIESVYKSSAGAVQAWAEDQAKIGLSAAEAGDSVVLLGAQLKNAGLSIEEAADQSQDLVALGADMAATFGGPTKDAVDALSAVFKGEFDSIEKYGVSIKASDVAARLAAKGQDKLKGSALKTAQAAAISAMVWEQTKDAQGQAAREADSFAGASGRATAELKNAGAVLAENVLPTVAGFVSGAADATSAASKWFGGLSDGARTAVVSLGLILAAAGPVTFAVGKTLQSLRAIGTGAQAVLSAGRTAATGLSLFRQGFASSQVAASAFSGKMGTLGGATRSAMGAVASATRAGAAAATSALSSAASAAAAAGRAIATALAAAARAVAQAMLVIGRALMANPWALVIAAVIALVVVVVKNWDTIKQYLAAAWEWIKQAAKRVWDAILAYFRFVLNAYRTVFTAVWNAIRGAVVAVWNGLKAAAKRVWDAILAYFRFVLNAYRAVFTSVWNAIRAAVTAVWNGLKAAAMAVFNALRAYFVAVLGVYRAVFAASWGAIRAVATGAWNGIRNVVTGIVRGLVAAVRSSIAGFRSWLAGAWNAIRGGAAAAWNGVKNAIVAPIRAAQSIVSGIVSRIAGAVNSVVGRVNGVIGRVNGLSFKLPKVGPIGGQTIGMPFKIPTIPRLAHGGILPAVPGGTLFIGGEAGRDEAVVPLPRGWRRDGGLGGASVTIQPGAVQVTVHAAGGDSGELRRAVEGAVDAALARLLREVRAS